MESIVNKYWEVWGQSDALYEEWATSHHLNSNHLFIFYALDRRDSVTQKMIADYTGLPKQTVNNVIRTFIADGYVTLSSTCADRREKRIILTEKGHAWSKEILTPLYELEERTFELMGAERVKQMIDTIMLFNTIFEKEMKRRT